MAHLLGQCRKERLDDIDQVLILFAALKCTSSHQDGAIAGIVLVIFREYFREF